MVFFRRPHTRRRAFIITFSVSLRKRVYNSRHGVPVQYNIIM